MIASVESFSFSANSKMGSFAFLLSKFNIWISFLSIFFIFVLLDFSCLD